MLKTDLPPCSAELLDSLTDALREQGALLPWETFTGSIQKELGIQLDCDCGEVST